LESDARLYSMLSEVTLCAFEPPDDDDGMPFCCPGRRDVEVLLQNQENRTNTTRKVNFIALNSNIYWLRR